MATYNLNQSGLDRLLDKSVSSTTENTIWQALISADLLPKGHQAIGVETELVGSSYTMASGDNFFLDTGLSNSMILTSQDGFKVIAAGDGGNSILDQGPGGDTLIGGAGADKLQVTQGNNVLIGGGGLSTLAGGSGHDFMTGDAMHFDGVAFQITGAAAATTMVTTMAAITEVGTATATETITKARPSRRIR